MSAINLPGETEHTLVAALRQGKQEALGKLYDAYAPVMMGVITRIVQDNDVAEEVLRETFITIWGQISKYDASKERLLSWGLALARRIALEAVKTDRCLQGTKAAATPSQSYPQLNKTETQQHEAHKQQDPCTLTPLEKTILESLYLKGHTCAETAAELNLTAEEVKQILKKAFTQLKGEKSV
ncbi:RNA polymerase sigma factor [Pontibacter liquoris]|uniref:RNA polymerase sigma factor n=1 Tax=Pontibacter liquoris TaxID=2905677 RepID=UPI001FA754C2|nr:sigma-70 family RNA polymerase sigma factor [Pontibacter liquoris]